VRRVAQSLSALTAAGLVLTACGGQSSPGRGSSLLPPRRVKDSRPVTPRWPADRVHGGARKDRQAAPPGPGREDGQHRVQPAASRPAPGRLVVEELVEGGLTRLAVFYYSMSRARSGRSASMRRQRHRRRLARARVDRDQRARPARRSGGSGPRTSGSMASPPGACTAPRTGRCIQPVRPPQKVAAVAEAASADPAELTSPGPRPATCRMVAR